jgi:hypothetical protein
MNWVTSLDLLSLILWIVFCISDCGYGLVHYVQFELINVDGTRFLGTSLVLHCLVHFQLLQFKCRLRGNDLCL